MISRIKKIAGIILLTAVFTSCKKEIGPLSDIKPAIAVTVTNAEAYRPEPTVTTSLSGSGSIQIVLSIPANSGRKIKEISKVTASTTYAAIQGIGPAIVYYNSAPIPATGITVTFTTSITEYFAKYAVSGTNPAAKANTELARRFYFLVTLDDNTVIIPQPVRILVLN